MIKNKICSKCGIEKPNTNEFYHIDRSLKSGLRGDCKICRNKKERQYNKINKEKISIYKKDYYKKNHEDILKYKRDYYASGKGKDQQLKWAHGISLKTYNKMSDSQNGVCAICGKTDNVALSVDHNHKTDKNRGLLCRTCNKTLGFIEKYKENPEKWDKYLEKYK